MSKPETTDPIGMAILIADLKSIAKWMDAIPDHKLPGGLVLSWASAGQRVAEAARVIQEMQGA